MRCLKALFRSLIVMAVFLGGSALEAFAEDAPETVELPPVVVQGETARDASLPGEGSIAGELTEGSKTKTPVEEIPQAVSVLDKEELSERGVQKVDEALRYTPGVVAQPFGADSDTDWIYIRGFDATQSGMFLDGLQLFSYAFAGFVTDSYLVDRIGVLRGPSSVLYGGSSAGGVVNVISKRATGERLYNVEIGTTNDPNAYAAFDIGNSFSSESPWSFRVVGRVKGGDTQTEYADNVRFVVSPSLLYEPDDATRLEIYSSYQYDKQRHMNGFFPYVGTVEKASYGWIPRDLYTSEPDEDEYEAQQASAGYSFEHQIHEKIRLASNTRWFYTDRSEYGPYTYDTDTTDAVLSRINFAHDTNAHLVETDNQAVLNVATGPVAHTVLTGIGYQFYRIDQWQASGAASDLDPINPVYTNTLPDLYTPYADDIISMNKIGVYAQDQLKWGNGWIGTANARYDSYWIDRNDRTSYNNDYTGNYGAWSGRAGLAYTFAGGFTPYASVSRFFEPQIGTDADGNSVDPQTGEQYEIGVKYSPGLRDAMITVSAFDLTRRNTLQTKFVGTAWETDTLGEIRTRGIEVQASVRPAGGLVLSGAVTVQDREITEDVDSSIEGNQPYLVPAVSASFNPGYTFSTGFAKGFGIGLGVRYQGKSYADNENTLEVPDATVYDAGMHYSREHWTVSLTANNVLDTRYIAGAQGAYCVGYGEGRSVLLKVSASF